jgi:hypothetical protein
MVLFCGLWFDLWETKGLPFCICLDWVREVNDSIKHTFFEAVEEEKIMNEVFEYDTYPVLAFNRESLNSVTDLSLFVNLIQRLCDKLRFNLYFNK